MNTDKINLCSSVFIRGKLDQKAGISHVDAQL